MHIFQTPKRMVKHPRVKIIKRNLIGKSKCKPDEPIDNKQAREMTLIK
jgi:hypothetical protein